MGRNRSAKVTRMSLAKGSKAPGKVKSPLVRELASLIKQLQTEELGIIRGLVNAELATRDRDGFALYHDSPRNRCVVALDQADMNCRLITGHGLVKISDYTEHKGPGDPSASTVIREVGGGCWVSALSEAGIGGDRYLEPVILRGSGARTRPGGGQAWSMAERVEALALAIERNHGYDLTKELWEHYRDIVSFETPTYPTLLGKREKNKKLVGGCDLTDMHVPARKLILRERDRFPIAAARLRLVAAVRTKEARRAAAKKRTAA
ncbi:MAG: hypothetical protein QOH16_648 [Gaiellaceae bacterium]|nr:hypothetical protein [Gaiellaceae bacterium]